MNKIDISFSMRLRDLEGAPIWVNWKETRTTAGGEARKVPYDPKTGRPAKSDDPATWRTLSAAKKRMKRLLKGAEGGGLGIVLTHIPNMPDWRLGGIDLDSCRDPDTGALSDWAEAVFYKFASYTEASPSGSGAKVFFLYQEADLETLRGESLIQRWGRSWSLGDHTEIALHLGGRYFTVTGEVIEDEALALLGGPDDVLRSVDLCTLRWLIEEHGPAFKGEVSQSAPSLKEADTSGSGYGWRFMARQHRLGQSYEGAREAILADDAEAGEWANRVDDRQLRRAWESACTFVNSRDPANQFTDIEDPDERTELGLPELDPIVAEMNRRHAVVALQNKTAIATFQNDGRVDFIGVKDLHTLYANRRVPVGKESTETQSAYWMRHPQRRTYPDGVVFDPTGTGSSGALNFWHGFAFKPDPTKDCSRILTHLLDVICQGDRREFGYLMGWLAHIFQRPGEKPEVAVILRGNKGVGKDIVAEYIARMIGLRHCPTIAQPEQLTGKFNAHMAATLLLHVQEGEWAGNRKAEGVLKYLISSKRVGLERKGVDTIMVDSFLRLLITSNERWVVPASWEERRYAVFDVGERRDREYYRALAEERDGGGPAALLHYFLHMDLSDFDVRTPPATKGLLEQKLASLRNIGRWWYEVLSEGEIPIADRFGPNGDWMDQWIDVGRSTLRENYARWLERQRYESIILGPNEFGKELRRLCPEVDEVRPNRGGDRSRFYRLPPLPRCRELFGVHLTGGATDMDWD